MYETYTHLPARAPETRITTLKTIQTLLFVGDFVTLFARGSYPGRYLKHANTIYIRYCPAVYNYYLVKQAFILKERL